MPEPHLHLLEVRLDVPAAEGPVELVMPSWTPGSYLLREFPRNVQDFQAAAGERALGWTKRDKGTWVVDAEPGDPVTVRYRVYANEPTVRTSHLDSNHAYVNGASVLLFARGREAGRHELQVEAPHGWKIATTLEALGDCRFAAASYDELVDRPLEIGTHEELEWEQEGKRHRYAVWGRGNHEPERLVADTKRIVAAESALFGGLPYQQYLFILHLLPEGRGGLEHRDCCSLQADRWAFEGEHYEDFLGLVAHELFHAWNAKRIHPAPLGPFDYTAENYTRSLWVVEGLTTYYTDLMLRRAGLVTRERYLERLALSIARLQALPGRSHQSLDEASFDTWIRFYRPDENTPNSQISYYQKGALVGLLLDLEIRRASSNERSLDDVMRTLWERYGRRDAGFPESGAGGVEAIAEEVAGTPLHEFFERAVRGTEELEYERYLAVAGLTLVRETEEKADAATTLQARLGIRTRERAGRPEISVALAGGSAARAGLSAGDDVVAVDGLRCASATQLADRIRNLDEGRELEITVFRRDELLAFRVPLGPAPEKLRIVEIEGASPQQEAVRRSWLAAGADDLDRGRSEGYVQALSGAAGNGT
jgi:predicted metalloprotease with PDZ domain